MTEASSRLIVKVKKHIKENWGSPFVVAFILLLLASAFSVSLGTSAIVIGSWADNASITAFLILFIGVILQIICVSKYKKGVVQNTGTS